MPLANMSDCPHDFIEREIAVTADGYCPLCMQAEIERLRTENRFLFDVIKDDALLVERYNAFNERRLLEKKT
jgi:hypothetical protein